MGISYFISLNPVLFKNIAHVWSFKHFVFVYFQDVQGVRKMWARCVQDVRKMCARCVQGVLNMCARCMHMSCLISLNPTHLENVAHDWSERYLKNLVES